jgi:predicted DNA-binding transcriptional regulator AlpA
MRGQEIYMARLLRFEDLLKLLPFSGSTLRRMIRSNDFPQGHLIGGCRVWHQADVESWIDVCRCQQP